MQKSARGKFGLRLKLKGRLSGNWRAPGIAIIPTLRCDREGIDDQEVMHGRECPFLAAVELLHFPPKIHWRIDGGLPATKARARTVHKENRLSRGLGQTIIDRE